MPEKKKILVADDDESICNLIKLVLEQNDFAVTTVNDGKSACDLVSADDGFDLIILDIVMPLMFGTDAAKEIRRLTDREYRLFKLLYDNKGVVIDIKTIFESVWGDKYMVSSNNTVMVFVLSLRKKIEDDYTHPKHIMTVWGRGYKYVED